MLNKQQKRSILNSLTILVDNDCEIKIVDILDSNEEALLVRYDFDDELATCVYFPDDDMLFTLEDWQGGYPANIDEIEQYNWYAPNGCPALVVNKLPRMFLI